MGCGIAQVFACAGRAVLLVDRSAEQLERAARRIRRSLRMQALLAPGGGVPGSDFLSRIRLCSSVADLRDAVYVIENVTECFETKRAVYEQLDATCAPEVCFGVNTSAIAITRMAAVTKRPDRVVGTHFMNPAPLMPMVEVIRGFHTSAETVAVTKELLAEAGKSCIVVDDSPGFVTNRVAMLMVNEAVFLLQEGVATADSIDRLFKTCLGHRMGPLETADLIGLDTVLLSLEVLVESFEDPKYRPCSLLKKLVHAGCLGQKSGRGFYDYNDAPARARARAELHE